jgi:hypothetical protein
VHASPLCNTSAIEGVTNITRSAHSICHGNPRFFALYCVAFWEWAAARDAGSVIAARAIVWPSAGIRFAARPTFAVNRKSPRIDRSNETSIWANNGSNTAYLRRRAREAVRTGTGMATQRSLGWQFGWLWAAFAVSTFGTWVAFDALAVIAILVRHAGPTEVSIMTAAGLAVGVLVAVPLGPWVEFRRKRPVMIAMDLIRFAALASIPAAFVLGRLSFAQLLAVSMIVGAANIVFRAASGAFLKALVPAPDLLLANGRFESTTWTAAALGSPLGGFSVR